MAEQVLEPSEEPTEVKRAEEVPTLMKTQKMPPKSVSFGENALPTWRNANRSRIQSQTKHRTGLSDAIANPLETIPPIVAEGSSDEPAVDKFTGATSLQGPADLA